jgi:tetratricopeptide (TPR) repeat protein
MKTLQYTFFIVLIVITSLLNGQSLRGLVNDGVDEYEENKFAEAEVNFKKGIEANVESFEPRFNLGDAIYKQGRFEEALEEFKNSAPLAKTDQEKASIFHNIGNTFIKSQKLQESIAAYKEALKLNPNDMETKYNLSYALKQMQNQQDNQQNQDNQDKNDQNKDQNKDQQNQDNQDKNEDQKDEQKNDQQQQDKKDDQQNQQQQPQEPKDEISKEEAKRILDALKNNEAELQKKMREQKTKKTNVEKDW